MNDKFDIKGSSNMGVCKRISNSLKRFRSDERGVSAVEFALVSPFLLGTFLGLVTILDTENTTTKVGKVTSSVADIIARAKSVNGDVIDGAFKAGKAMLGNLGNNTLKIYVAGIEVDDDQEINVKWICGRRFTNDEMDDAVDNIDLPSQLKQAPSFYVVSYGEYDHTPIFGGKFGGGRTYEYNNYFVPRNSLETLNEGCGG